MVVFLLWKRGAKSISGLGAIGNAQATCVQAEAAVRVAVIVLLLAGCAHAPIIPIVGAAVPGMPGSIWADRDVDGYADGCIIDGEYVAGGCGAAPPERT